MKKILFFLFLTISYNVYAASMNMIGEKGDPKNIDRTIEIKMYDNYYEPNLIKIFKRLKRK